MQVNSFTLKELFEAGNFKQLTAISIDAPGCEFDEPGLAYCIAALTFLGRIEDAAALYRKTKWQDEAARARAGYWLGVGYARKCAFAKAREHFCALRRMSRQVSDDEVGLFAHLGLAFYYYWTGRLQLALNHARFANDLCLVTGSVFERVVAQDSIAHLLVNLGEVRKGLQTFSRLEEMALAAGFDWVVHALKVSQTLYRSNFGISGRDALYELQELLAEQAHEDSYNKANLFIEIGRQHILRGDLQKAKASLDLACQNVYQSDNLRLTSHLNLVLAYLLQRQGEDLQALHIVKNIYQQNQDNPHRLLLVKARGLEVSLLKRLQPDSEALTTAKKELAALTMKTQYFQSVRRRDRDAGEYRDSRQPGVDPLGDLLDRVAREGEQSCPEIIKQEYYGFLNEALQIETDARIIYFDLHRSSTTIFDSGSVYWLGNQLSDLMRKVIIELASADSLSKEELCVRVWEQNYNPLRHDPLVYSVISKIRRLHPVLNDWLDNNEHGYYFESGVRVKVHRTADVKVEKMSPQEVLVPESSELSFRQSKGLGLIKRLGAIDARTYRDNMNISEATASRDLAQLHQLNFIDRVGKGRATKYIYSSGGDSHESMD